MIWLDRLEGIPAPLGTHVAFYYSPTPVADPLSSSLHLIANGVATIAPVPGQFNGGTKTTDVDAGGGSTIYVSIRGWTGNYATWDLAFAAAQSGTQVLMGATTPFAVATGNPAGPSSDAADRAEHGCRLHRS